MIKSNQVIAYITWIDFSVSMCVMYVMMTRTIIHFAIRYCSFNAPVRAGKLHLFIAPAR